jgi:hypothetical protein
MLRIIKDVFTIREPGVPLKPHKPILRVPRTAEVKKQFEQQGLYVETSTTGAFRADIRSQVAIFAQAIKASGAKVE